MKMTYYRARFPQNRPSTFWAILRVTVVSLFVAAICTVCVLPQIVFLRAWPQAHRLVEPLETYREAHGVYPDSVEALAAAQRPPIKLDAIHYTPDPDRLAFRLLVSSWDERGGYDSKTGKWRW